MRRCHPGVQLETYWDYEDDDACMGMTAQQGLKWNFYDSSGLRWTRTDIAPTPPIDVSIYPVSWDGTHRWKLEVGTLYQIPGCNVGYHWELTVFVAECD